jgi:hypothetical protein
MDSNTHSVDQLTGPAEGFAALAAALQGLAAQPLDGLPDAVRAERVLELRRLLDRLEGHWLAELAAVDAAAPPGPNTTSSRRHHQLAAHPPAPGRRRRPQQGPDRPGPVRWPSPTPPGP